MDEETVERFAQVMNYAYRKSNNRENAVALAKHHLPAVNIELARAAWECIDAYVDNDESLYPKVL